MDIIGGIAAATEDLKLVNELRKIDAEMDKAELKLRLVDLADRLVDSKQALLDAKENEQELSANIKQIEKRIALIKHLEDEQGRLYKKDENGNRIGEPYCNYCFVKEEKLFRLRYYPGSEITNPHHFCDNCDNSFRR